MAKATTRTSVGGALCAVTVFILGFWFLLIPVLDQARQAAWVDACMTNQTRLFRATSIYADANNDRLPISDRWMDDLAATWNKPDPLDLKCPALASGEYGYAMNEKLSGKRQSEIKDDNTPVYFETDLTNRNAAGSLTQLLKHGRHGPRPVITYIDGKVNTLAGWPKWDQGSPSAASNTSLSAPQ